MLIYEALKKDHDLLKVLLEKLTQAGDAAQEEREQLISQVRDELIPHSRAEEKVFYNALREVKSAQAPAWHGFEEHATAEALLRTLQGMETFGADWSKTARKLRDALEHHIEEEETKLFLLGKQLFSSEEAKSMGEAFEALKPRIKEGGFLKSTIDLVKNMIPPKPRAERRS